MRYRIYGRREDSGLPVEPFYVDAADEEDARNRAAELGTVVDRVEVAGQEQEAGATEPSPRPQDAAPFSVTADRPSPRRLPSRPRARWLLLGFLLVLAALAVGVGIGTMVPRISRIGSGARTSATGGPAGIRIEELKQAEELFALTGQEAVVLKYSGGEVAFWIEIEAQGKTEKINSGPGLPVDNKPPAPNQTVEGYFVWVRSPAEDGMERWKVACRRDLVTAQTAGVQISNPMAEVNASQSQEHTNSTYGWSDYPQRVWKGEPPGDPPGSVMNLTSSSVSIPSPLPTDREVCLKTIREERRKTQTDQPRDRLIASACTLGLLGSPGGEGPLLAASALHPKRPDETMEAHTLKVMCRVVSEKEKQAGGEPSGK